MFEDYHEPMRSEIKVTLLLIFAMVMFCSCSYLNSKAGLKDDNAIEEIAEVIIENQLGVDIDLTPGSPE